MRVVLVVIASLVSFVAVGGLGTLAIGLSSSRVITDSQALPAGTRVLTVDTGDVPVVVRLITDADASGPRVDLRMLTRAADTHMTVASDTSGSRITLGDRGSGLLWPVGAGTGEVKVILPPGVARGLSVTVSHRTGSLTTEADLDQLIAKIDNGAVTLGGSARRVDVSVGHGDISTSTRIAVVESFRATTESGNISVEFRAAPRTIEAVADGDVTVGVPGPDPYRVRAQSERIPGKTMVTVPETTDPTAPEVTAHSKSGNVLVAELR
jgi:hypothetical protein